MTNNNHSIVFRARYTTIRIRDINDGEKDTIILNSASILRKMISRRKLEKKESFRRLIIVLDSLKAPPKQPPYG